MAEQELKIVAIRGNRLLVETQASGACGSCASKRQCGSDSASPRWIEVAPAAAGQLRVADTVKLSLPSGELLRMAGSVYLPSLLGLLLGMLAGAASSDTASLAGGGAGFGAGLLCSRWLSRRAAPIQHQVERLQPGAGAARKSCAG